MEEDDKVPDRVNKICATLEERDKIILEMDVGIKYYKDVIEAREREIKELEKDKKRLAEDDKAVDDQLSKFQFIKNSLKESRDISVQSLTNHQILEKVMNKELDTKLQQTKRVKEEFRMVYSEAKTQITENPLYQELEKSRVEFLIVDIKARNLEVQYRTKKEIATERAKIQKKLFYNFFILVAEDYMAEKKWLEQQELKMQKLKAIKKLYVLQERAKMRQKMGAPRDKVKKMTNIIFGSQDSQSEKPANRSEMLPPTQPKQTDTLLDKKFQDMFHQDDMNIPQKVRIIDHTVIPPFVAPQFPLRKVRTVDLSKHWQKMIRKKSSEKRISSSQQSDKSSQDSSQQSQLSQKSLDNQNCREVIASPAEPAFELVHSVEGQNSQLTPTKEKYSCQFKMQDTLNDGNELMIVCGDTSQPTLSGFTDRPILPTNNVVKPRSILAPQESNAGKIVPKQDSFNKMSFGESGKSVRFNLELGHQSKETKGLFEQSFRNPFGSFFGRAPSETVKTRPNTSSSFNMSLMEPTGGNSLNDSDFDAGPHHSSRSPDFSYAMDGEEGQSFKSTEMPAFDGNAGGGFFPFDSKPMFPFQ